MEYCPIFNWYVFSRIRLENVGITTILAMHYPIFQVMDYSVVLWAWALYLLCYHQL